MQDFVKGEGTPVNLPFGGGTCFDEMIDTPDTCMGNIVNETNKEEGASQYHQSPYITRYGRLENYHLGTGRESGTACSWELYNAS